MTHAGYRILETTWTFLRSILLFGALIAAPAAMTGKLIPALTAGTVGIIIGAISAPIKSKWRFLLIIFWWIALTYFTFAIPNFIPSFNPRELTIFSIIFPPVLGYYVALDLLYSKNIPTPHSSSYAQWSDGLYTKGHINNPTAEQILAEFDKLDGSARSVLQVQFGLKRVEICVVNDDLTVFYHTDNHKRKDPWHAVYPPDQTEEGEYYGPFGGYEEIEFPLYVFISKSDCRRALKEFLATGERPQSFLWLDCETESDLPLPPWE